VTVADRVVAALRAPFALGDREMRVGASVGIAVACGAAGVDDLLRNADVAMYRAKGRGKGRHETFAPEMHAAIVDRLDLETGLRHALPRGELVLHFQPVVALDGGRFVGAEALLRWRHPRRGVVAPNAFIPLAEATGVILPIGRWVLAEACLEAARWTGRADGPAVSVNVSGRQLEDPEFQAHVAEALAAAGLDPRRLILEITEGTLMRDTDAALRRLRELKALGVRLAVDDFGTGFSSLAYLQRFPVDVLKIDKAFVDGVASGGRNTALARTVIALGDALGMSTVAEGIEDAAQQAQLVALGCRHGQGYLFARPMAPEALRAALAGGERQASAA
jgi:EAL domain-containing protein (putative c-di-GMP-specific phosphodiesterase class I)